MNELDPSEEVIFNAARQFADAEKLRQYLDLACEGQPEFRQRIERLLGTAREADSFFGRNAVCANNLLAPAADVAPVQASSGASEQAPGKHAGFQQRHRSNRAPPPADEAPGRRIGRYKLLGKIGEGGCGVVYMADQEEPVKRRVALKVIKPGMDTKEILGRFEAERQALALMDHPNIAKVLEAGATETGRPFVMELVRGIPITRFCDENRLPTRQRLELFIQVCRAIQHAHQKGIIHRDIKPSNILVADHDGVPVPKIIDFGIAKATAGQTLTDKTVFTALEQFIGTPAYMSPEQAKMSALDVDTRSDIYSLGVLLYELLTGKTPFDARRLFSAGLDEIRRVIREEEPQRPSQKLSTLAAEDQTTAARARQTDSPRLIHLVRGDLDWIVMKCLEKDRARRYETANGLAADLNRHLENEPVVARPPSNLYRFQKMVRRNKLAFAAGAMVALALLVGMALATWQAVRASRERDAKELALREQTRLRSEAETAQQQTERARQQAQAQAKRAEAAAGEVRMTLAASDFAEARRLIGSGDAADAVAYLSRILSTDPANFAALSQLATLLTYHSWMVPSLSLKHEDYVTSAQFSPDGRRILTASWDHTARVWDAQTGQPLVEPMRQAGHIVARFSPDGRRIVTASGDGTARVWDAQTGQPLTQLLQHKDRVEWAEFSPDSARVVTASDDGTARVWDAQTGRLLTEVKHEDHVLFAQFSPDGKRIVTASRDNTARVWDAQTGQSLTGPLRHDLWVTFAEFSPDGKCVLTASTDNTARLWDAQTGQPLAQPLTHQDHIWSARFSPDGKRIVTASADNTARVWDAQTGLPLTEPLRHEARVWFARFSPDGTRVVSASEDNTARLWEAQTGQLLAELRLAATVLDAEFSPDGKWIVTASLDNTARVWNAPIAGAIGQSMGEGTRAQFSRDGKKIVTAGVNFARVLDAQTGRPLTQPLENDMTVYAVYDAQFSPDGNRVATATQVGTVRVWDAQTGQPLTGPLKHGNRVYTSQFSPNGARILTASWDNTARVWDARTGQLLIELLGHTGRVNFAQYSPDGKRVATASQDGTARIWDAQTGQSCSFQPLKHDNWVMSAQFSPDGKRVLTASTDNTARVWDAQTGQPLTGPLKHKAFVFSAQFSPDGIRILTASFDKTARVWDAQTGQPLTQPLPHRDQVWFARFSPDGTRIVTTVPMTTADWLSPAQFSPDGNRILTASSAAQIWDAQTGLPLTEPLVHENAPPLPSAADAKGIETRPQDKDARIWDVGFVPSKLPDWLVPLAEAISGQRLNKQGILEETTLDRAKTIAQIRQDLKNQPDNGDGVAWGRWLLADPAKRTISPFSSMTVSAYVENQIKEQTQAAEDDAVGVALGNDDLSQQISKLGECLPAAYGNSALLSQISDLRDRMTQIDVLSSNGLWHVRFGQWSNAVVDYSKLIQIDASNQWNHLLLAPLLVQSGDVDGYYRHCAQVLAIFRGTKQSDVAEPMAKACLILPPSRIDLEAVAQLADTAVASGTGPWIALAKGLAEYRQGHFASAMDWMQKTLADPSEAARHAEAWLVIAMALHQSGKLAESRAALDKAAELVETKRPKVGSYDYRVIDWLIADALMKEAKGLIR